MDRRMIVLALALALALAGPAPGDAAVPGGLVSRREGVVHVLRAGVASPLAEGDPVFQGVRLRTGPGSKVRIECADGLVVVIGPATEVSVADYFDGGEAGGLGLVLGLLEGIVRLARPVARLNPYATPDPRLFLCSSSTPPGPGVLPTRGVQGAGTKSVEERGLL